jgi:hypothetical protein
MPLLFANVINRGTTENEIIKEIKAINIIKFFLFLKSNHCYW